MEIHFYESKKVYPKDCEILHDWESARNEIKNKMPMIHTTQMCELSASRFLDGYRLFVHQGNGIVYEVTLRIKNKKYEDIYEDARAIRLSQNAYAMWASNVFRE